MHNLIYNIINTINDAGFEAYIVGGAVRSIILKEECTDIDVATNCPQQELIKLFPGLKIYDYGASKVVILPYKIEFTYYRKEEVIIDGKPISYELASTIEEDAIRRDITINAIYMDKDYQIHDFFNGMNDLKKHRIELIGEYDRLNKDPLKILRIIRFMITLDFHINPDLMKYINKSINELSHVSYIKVKDELNKIFASKNFNKYINFLLKIDFFNALNLKLKTGNLIYTSDVFAMWAQFNNYDILPFTKIEKDNIKRYELLIKEHTINNEIILYNGLYVVSVIAPIIGISPKTVTKMYQKLPMKNINELAISASEVMNILNITKIGNNMNIIIKLILAKTVKNDKIEIKNYLLSHKEDFNECNQ